MPLSWSEIRARAAAFINEWKDSQTVREKADAQTFETEFLHIFGVDRKKTALFEHEVRYGDRQPNLFKDNASTGGERGYIDLFWKGNIIIEMKTPGKDLHAAFEQAKKYALSLPQKEIPKCIVTSDFLNFQYYDLEDNAKRYEFPLTELIAYLELFSHLAGYTSAAFYHFDPVNIEAAERMGKLYDYLKASEYEGHQLKMYLVRLLFCFFADATGIFPEKNMFFNYIQYRTAEDGSDLALHLGFIFDTLNKTAGRRLLNLDDDLKRFPYVDGGLFEERLETAVFDLKTRETLLWCCALDWSKISPAIFGAMFQSVMDDTERHDIGAHYTSEKNILKLIQPLFLDELREEFNKIKNQTASTRKHNLLVFHNKLRGINFLDPACGCGNFLVVSYRELRRLEIAVIKEIMGLELGLSIEMMLRVNVNQFYGIEIEEFPARIAQTALWLMDHLMNNEVSSLFSVPVLRIPLTASPSIVIGNALTMDWETVIPKDKLSYLLGNPPFLGASVMNREQKKEVETVFARMKGCDSLDYVTCWYKKAACLMRDTHIETAFVSTNSICQGEQVPLLWPELMDRYGIHINFAHHTFKWSNEARGNAAVYCVIIGFSQKNRENKKLFQYSTVTGNPAETPVKRINAYLVDAENIFIKSRAFPLCKVSAMVYGNKPTDGGHLLFTREERDAFIKLEPKSKKYIKPFISAHEYLHGKERFCLWLVDVEPSTLKKMLHVLKRLKLVQRTRLASKKEATRALAATPGIFEFVSQPDTDFILVPRHSSENRKYIPIGFFSSGNIAADSCSLIPEGTLYHFGVLTSAMHMAWMRCVCGRIKSDYRYSASIVYNNFPWPAGTGRQAAAIEKAAEAILSVRLKYPKSTLAALYDPLTMPKDLLKAHQKLDKLVEKAYGRDFANDGERVAYLFERYQKISGELFVDEKKRGKGRKI